MPTENDFLPFAAGSGANVETQSTWASDSVVAGGFATGVANSAQVNKVLRQSSIMAAMLAQFIVDHSGQPAIDNSAGMTSGSTGLVLLETNLLAAINAVITVFAASALGSGGTIYTPQFNALTTIGLDPNGAGVRITNGNYGVILRNDGSNFYILLTNSGSPNGTFNSLRAFAVNLSTGAVSIDATGVGTTFGGTIHAASSVISANETVAGSITAGSLSVSGAASVSGLLTALANMTVTGTLTATYIAATTFTGAPYLSTPTPTGTRGNALASASMFTSEFPVLPNVSGYYRLPNYMIEQWGSASVSGSATVTFPTAFPSQCLNLTATEYSTSAGTVTTDSVGLSSFVLRIWTPSGAVQSVATNVQWRAVGY